MVILHSDLNCFYASVEMCENPTLRGQRVAVCGSAENRHGIVLTASYPAKRAGVKTGMANWQALGVCPDLIMVPPRYDLYLQYSRCLRWLYREYADDIEPFGMDECWIALRGTKDPAAGVEVADELRRRIRESFGLTASIGVSFNKVFAKLGSDYKKPDATTAITRDNFRDLVWPLPVSDLLYCGPATTRKLDRIGVHTIGELAERDPADLRARFGKNGVMLWRFANGADSSPVAPDGYRLPIKSVGHGATCVYDLETDYDVWRALLALSQDIGHRMRGYGLLARGVQLTVRDRDLAFEQYQMPLDPPTRSPLTLSQAAFSLFRANYSWQKPVRALTVTGIRVGRDDEPRQTDLFGRQLKADRQRALDDAVDDIRSRFGENAVLPASLLGQKLPLADDRCETVPMPPPMFRE